MTTWDLNQTYMLVREVFGREQEKLAKESLRSVNDRKSYSSYHFSEAMRLSKTFERKHLSNTESLLEIYVDGAEDKQAAFERFIIEAGAHSVAAVQSLHAIPDIFAHAIYYATAQNLQENALAEHDICLPKVAERLKHEKNFATLSKQLSSMQSGAGWQHLAAASNMSKHRSIIRSTYTEDWSGIKAEHRELCISAFKWRKNHHPAKSLRELLEPEYNRLFKTVLTIGHELNGCLSRLITAT